MNVLDNPTLVDRLDIKDIIELQEFVDEHGEDFVTFQCECCSQYGACHVKNTDIILPIPEGINLTEEDTKQWLIESGFRVVGRYVNRHIQIFN